MGEIDLGFIGERLERVQADLRMLRGAKDETIALRSELNALRNEVNTMRAGNEVRFAGLDARLAQLQSDQVELRRDIGARFAAVDAQFELAHQTMTTNLMVTLKAIEGLQHTVEGLQQTATAQQGAIGSLQQTVETLQQTVLAQQGAIEGLQRTVEGQQRAIEGLQQTVAEIAAGQKEMGEAIRRLADRYGAG